MSLCCPTFRGGDEVLLSAEQQLLGDITENRWQETEQKDRDLLRSTLRGPAAPGTPVVHLAKFLTNHKHLFVGKNKTQGTHKKLYFTEINYWFI